MHDWSAGAVDVALYYGMPLLLKPCTKLKGLEVSMQLQM